MARECRRLLIGPERLAEAGSDALPLLPDEARYLTRVLRFCPGAELELIDGAGGLWQARLLSGQRLELLQPPAQPLRREPAPRPRLQLAVALVKRDFDLLVRMAVELGVDDLQPWHCDHSAVLGQPKAERWRSIAREAAEQCERLWLPQLHEPCPLADDLESGAAGPSGAEAARGEAPGGEEIRLWATTRRPDLPELGELLQDLEPQQNPPSLLRLACGPEGGWSAAEEELAEQCGWRPVQLGPRILRSSTAAVAGITQLASWRQRRWGC
jgi:16S rRNA (uracil1498-N3)-methyltransferase